MSVRMVILGLLREKQLYGYEIKHIIEDHMGDWTSIAFGSIYFALGRLSKEGFIRKVAEEKQGKRPSKSVYEITERGKMEFLLLLRGIWENVKHESYDLDLALFFSDALSKKELLQYIKKRIQKSREVLRHIREHKNEQLANKDVPARAEAIFEHTYLHLIAEYKWLKKVYQGFAEGKY